MKVKEVMKTSLITVKPGDTYGDVARLLNAHKISGVLVVDQSGKLVGVVSEKDLFRILYPLYKSYYENPEIYQDSEEREEKVQETLGHRVENFMSRNLVTVSPEMPIMEAGSIMLAKKVHRLPVVAGDRLVGIVTRKDIYSAVINHHLSSKQ